VSRSAIAVLLSALVFPGIGHLYLKQNARGIALIAASTISLWFIIDSAMRQASAILDQIEAGGGVIDTSRISELAAQTPSTPGDSLATYALAACWLLGIIDAYRLGKKKSP
jgi:TM2 domain-containing membrane protein YozV